MTTGTPPSGAPRVRNTHDTILGAVMVIVAALIAFNWLYLDSDALWDWIDGASIIALLLGAWHLIRPATG